MNGSALRSNGPMQSLAGLSPEPSLSPCAPLYCELAAAPSAGGPIAAERDVPDSELLSLTPIGSPGSDLKLLPAESFCLSALLLSGSDSLLSFFFFKLQWSLYGEFSDKIVSLISFLYLSISVSLFFIWFSFLFVAYTFC